MKQRRDVNSSISLDQQHCEGERTGRFDNFRIASGWKEGTHRGRLASDADVYKWLEAVAWTLATEENTELEAKAGEIIGFVEKAQEKSGYINTGFQIGAGGRRWTNLLHGHELYCGGHLILAAVAWRRCTGDGRLMDTAVRWAEYVSSYFGESAHSGTPGHPLVEMALVELYRETGEKKYLELACFFVESRGKGLLGGDENAQDHLPVREQVTVAGHAVRQLYLAAGMTDICMETGDRSLFETIKKQWKNFTGCRMAITGGAGSRYRGEEFGLDYELPNRTGYYETCASIASFMWAWRMLLVTGDSSYADAMENALYNGILSGVSLDGTEYFYTNPLEHDGAADLGPCLGKPPHRGSNRRTSRHWDYTSCCPPNLARLLGKLPGYIYGTGHDRLYINHFVSSHAVVEIGGARITVMQKSAYPWDGNVDVAMDPPHAVDFELLLRIPGWAEHATVCVNGNTIPHKAVPGTFFAVNRRWVAGDEVHVQIPMPVQRIYAHPNVTDNKGCVALKRGPVVYCIESADHPGKNIYHLAIPENSTFQARYREDMLGGIVTLEGKAVLHASRQELYAATKPEPVCETGIVAVPYLAWANREPGAMLLWLPLCRDNL